MKKLLTTACLFVVTAVAIVTFIAPAVFGQRAKVNPSPAKSVQQAQIKAGMDAKRLAKISARMKEFVDSGVVAGAVTLVARPGVVVSLSAVGYQDLETKMPMRTDTIFQIRSMTKRITAVGIMILLEEGRLLLSDPVAKYVPEFRDQLVVDKRDGEKILSTAKPSRAITIRDLLTHTSGMGGATESDRPPSASLAESITPLPQVPLEFQPGTKVLYSNAGFETLGRIIEVASGQPYEKFIEQRILRPLGMKDSFFFPPPEKCNRIASHYEPQDGKLKRFDGNLNPDLTPDLNPDWKNPDRCRKFAASVRHPGPSWGLFSTASDMAMFFQMMLNGGAYKDARIVSTASVEIMTAVQTGDLTGVRSSGYGFGWSVQPGERIGFLSPGAYSGGGLRGTFGWADPQKATIGILMIQIEPGPSQNSIRQTFVAMTYAAIVE